MRRTIVAGVLGLLLAAGALPAAAQRGEAGRPPNIVLILADDLGYEVLGSSGGTSYRTPHLDRLAAEGMRFERAYAMPLCTPTRVQIMTGKHNFRNYVQFGLLSPGERTFANYLRDAGYATAVAGKWQLGGDERTPDGFGFDEYLLWQLEAPDFWTRYRDPVVSRSGAGTDTLAGRYGPDVFVEFIDDFMTRHREEPFFVYYPMALVHDPFQPPPGHPEFATVAIPGTNDTTYFAPMVAHMDAVVGRIVERLEALGLRENTLLLFTGDNGTDRDVVSRMGERVIRGDKGNTTDAGTHVPLVASWPGTIPAGQVRGELVDIVDFLPTLLDAARVPAAVQRPADGISLYPTLRTGAVHPRRWIYRDYDAKGRDFPPRRYAQNERYKLYDDGRFFDFVRDPLEERPIPRERLDDAQRRAWEALDGVIAAMRRERERGGVGTR